MDAVVSNVRPSRMVAGAPGTGGAVATATPTLKTTDGATVGACHGNVKRTATASAPCTASAASSARHEATGWRIVGVSGPVIARS
jgi:hypothetical protein